MYWVFYIEGTNSISHSYVKGETGIPKAKLQCVFLIMYMCYNRSSKLSVGSFYSSYVLLNLINVGMYHNLPGHVIGWGSVEWIHYVDDSSWLEVFVMPLLTPGRDLRYRPYDSHLIERYLDTGSPVPTSTLTLPWALIFLIAALVSFRICQVTLYMQQDWCMSGCKVQIPLSQVQLS